MAVLQGNCLRVAPMSPCHRATISHSIAGSRWSESCAIVQDAEALLLFSSKYKSGLQISPSTMRQYLQARTMALLQMSWPGCVGVFRPCHVQGEQSFGRAASFLR
eukprot:6204298-Pleurochrysis_carterae.AAC.7